MIKYKTMTTTLDPCSDTTLLANNSQLASACACKRASDAFVNLVKQYEDDFQNYNIKHAKYQNYLLQKQRWQQGYDNVQSAFAAQRQNGSCAAAWACGSSDCPSGWEDDGSVRGRTGNCRIAGVNTGCSIRCKPSSSTIDAHMNEWKRTNPEPEAVAPPGEAPSPPSGNNILCCSQLFSGITADNLNLQDITQQCSQTINTQIAQAIAPTTPTQTTATPSASSTSNNTFDTKNQNTKIFIGISVATGVLILLFILILIVVFSQQK